MAIVGIGEDGAEGLGAAARAAIGSAEQVFGGGRHLELARTLIRGEAEVWPRPFDTALDRVWKMRGRRVCVLASGDPLLHGVGARLLERVPLSELYIVPGVSSFSWAASRLGWDLAETTRLALHASSLHAIRRALQPGARILALSAGEDGAARLAQLLEAAGLGDSDFFVLEALGGARENVLRGAAREFVQARVARLHTLGIEVRAGAGARCLPLAAGIPDEWFEHDGQLTRREARALALAALAPHRGERLWDVGAGAGSIAIEWLLCDPSLRAVAIEARPQRAERIRRNAATLGAPALEVCQGRAPAALAGLEPPDAIFVGGGASDSALLDAALAALAPGGRIVVHGVTLQTERELLARREVLGGDLLRFELARVGGLGSLHAWEPARPLLQWRWVRP